MRVVIVSHGKIDNLSFAKGVMARGDMLVCADGGAEYAFECGLTPDVCVGDFDSIPAGVLDKVKKSGCRVIQYPREKDYTDTQLAISCAMDMGADEIVLLGSIGDRVDHTLANIFLLVGLIKSNIKASIVNEKNTIYITNSCIKVDGKPGDLLSVIPIAGDAVGVKTEGLKYKLSGQTIKMGNPVGVSNVFTSYEAVITIDSGTLLVIKSMD